MDGIKDRVRSAKVTEEHDKEVMIGQLMELCVSTLMVVMKDGGYSHQNLGGCVHAAYACVYICICMFAIG